jgi:hypothetical protein
MACSRHKSWYRYWRRPGASVPMAWIWPWGSTQIPAAVWLATTDADTLVPPDWLRR